MRARRAQKPKEYSEEEKELVLDYVRRLPMGRLKDVLRGYDLPVTGTKEELFGQITEGIEEGSIEYEELVVVLDDTQPWGKQHVILYGEPVIPKKPVPLSTFKDKEKFYELVREHKFGHLIDNPVPLALPPKLTPTSITHDGKTIRVVAVSRRVGLERVSEKDEANRASKLVYHAYKQVVVRGLVIFEWNVLDGAATMQITQLTGGSQTVYEKVEEEFAGLVGDWLPVARFPKLEVRRAIEHFHDQEKKGDHSFRAAGLEFVLGSGRKVSARASSDRDGVMNGETVIIDAMENMRRHGNGYMANIYAVAGTAARAVAPGDEDEEDYDFDEELEPESTKKPKEKRIHLMLLAKYNRINVMRGSSEDEIHSLLKRIRVACIQSS